MVAPVTGPFITTLVNVTATNYNEVQMRRSYRQIPPFTLRLTWARWGHKTRHTSGQANAAFTGLWNGLVSNVPPIGNVSYFWPIQTAQTDSYNTAFSRLVNALRQGNSANLGVSLIESGQSLKMIVQRLSSFTKAFRALRKGKLGDALAALSIRPDVASLPKRRKGQSKESWLQTVANNFLEYQFGWKPLCSDIWDAFTVLTADPVKPVEFSVGSKRQFSVSTPYDGQTAVCNGWTGVRLACTAVTSNPNLALANQLGLVNPLTVAWEVVTLSFLFDWFANVKKLLNSFTDLWGFTVTNCAVTRWIKYNSVNTVSYPATITEEGARAQRDPVSAFGPIKFRMRLPVSDDPSLMGKAISLAALAVQNLSLFKSKGI